MKTELKRVILFAMTTLIWVSTCKSQTSPPDTPKGLVEKMPAVLKGEMLKEAPDDSELRKLSIARFNSAKKVAFRHWIDLFQLRGDCDHLLASARRMVAAGNDVLQPSERLEFMSQFVDFVNKLVPEVRRVEGPNSRNFEKIQEFYLEVEIEITKLKKELKTKEGNGSTK